jgi:hypothetical protein
MPVNNHNINIDHDAATPHHYHHRFSSDNGHKTTVDWGFGMLGMHGIQWERAQTMRLALFEL